jgi:ubiquinone/menaquinone biosynthesis C-methylase UbiE
VSLRGEILEANVNVHRIEAEVYDGRHGEIFNRHAQGFVEGLVRRCVERVRGALPPGEEIRALDCACGTGNVTMKLLAAGCRVDALDISREMLDVMVRKLPARYRGRCEAVHSDADSHLEAAGPGSYHLITFSSALHHVPDYRRTFRSALKALARPGVVCVIHEPLPEEKAKVTAVSRLLRKADRLAWKYHGRIIRRRPLPEKASAEELKLSDCHTGKGGVDPDLLAGETAAAGGEVAEVILRSENMRHWWSSWADNAFGLRRDGFAFIAVPGMEGGRHE